MKSLKLFVSSFLCVLAISAPVVLAWDIERDDVEHRGILDVAGPFRINHEPVTATADDLNNAGDLTNTAANIDASVNHFMSWRTDGVQILSVTNGQIVTVTNPVVRITGILGTNTAINTIVLANPPFSGYRCTFIVQPTTNFVSIADSGNAVLSQTFTGAASDTITLLGNTATQWVEVAKSDN